MAGWALFPGLTAIEIALIAAILAPTDAALGKPVVTNPAVPGETREALNVESGLNDGLCVPLVLLLLEVAVGTEVARQPLVHISSRSSRRSASASRSGRPSRCRARS